MVQRTASSCQKKKKNPFEEFKVGETPNDFWLHATATTPNANEFALCKNYNTILPGLKLNGLWKSWNWKN